MSIYIHIPFCKSICSYCDFAKLYYDCHWINDYLDSLEYEIKTNYKGEEVNTVYVGGGTPSSLSKNELKRLFEIIKIFNYKDIEFTFECNVNDITEELLTLLKESGVNRLSIGIESFNPKILKFLNRDNNIDDIIKRVDVAKKYFTNINVDIMYAIPGETLKDLENDIDKFLSLDVPHISTYSLIIEPHTALYNKVDYIDSDLDREMYDLIIKKLSKYNHYEISNFAKPEFESKHNLVYWNNEQYYGFGLGASSYIDNIRYSNTRNITDYIKHNYIFEKEVLSKNEIIENAFILGLRKLNGINKKEFYERYNLDITSIDIVKKLIGENKLIDDGKNIKISSDLIYVQNSILIEFIGENYE